MPKMALNAYIYCTTPCIMVNTPTFFHICIYLVTIVCTVHTSLAGRGNYPIKNFTPIDYKAGIQNIDFAQNRNMSVYVANNLGVLAYNGKDWERHAFRTGKKQRSLAFDEVNERLYVGAQGEFGYFEKNWHYVSLSKKIPQVSRDFDEVWDVFLFDSQVYFCTFQGIYVYNGASVSIIQRDVGFNRSFKAGNRLFTQTQTGKLFEIKGLKLSSDWPQGQTGQIVAGMLPKAEGCLVFYNSGHIEFSTLLDVQPIYPELRDVLVGKYVNHVTQLSDGRIAVATQRGGLYLYNPFTKQTEHIGKKDGLLSNVCLRVFQDHAGSLWVGMQNGIALIDINSPLRLISQEVGIEGSGYDAYDREEGRYYTTSNGIYFSAKGSNKSLFLGGTEGPAYGLQVIKGKLYAGHHTGLFLLANGQAKRVANTDGLWLVKQWQANPRYAIAGTYSGLHLFELNEQHTLTHVHKIAGFNESSRFFEEDRQGRLWVGQFYRGLYKLHFDELLTRATVAKVSDSSRFPIQQHIILSKINDELYLGTKQGIYKIDQSTAQVVESDLFTQQVGNDKVYLLMEDRQQNIHVFTDRLMGFFNRVSTNNYTYVPSSLYPTRQSLNNDLLYMSRNVDEGVLVNANSGFVHYSPSLEGKQSIKHLPFVKQIYHVDADSALYGRLPFEAQSDRVSRVEIMEGTKVTRIELECFDFYGLDGGQYRYWLKGFDEGYSEWTDVAVKEYTNLKPGEYLLFVQTRNSLGYPVDGMPLRIEVNPLLYKSPTARAMYVLLFALLLYMLYRVQQNRFKGKANRIEKDKEIALARKQDELQALKDTQIKSELRHVNNLLAASTMNLVVKNEFIINIKEEIDQVRKNGATEDTQKALMKLIKAIDTTLKLQEDWKQFEYHFDRVHGDFLTRLTNEFLDLTPGEQKLCAFLRLKMDTKEIANLMNISLRGVEVARYRLRKKLGLDTRQNLSKFILEY